METLFIGNGINRIKEFNKRNEFDFSWKKVIDDLKDEFNKTDYPIEDIPFPIVYEEIFLKTANKDQNTDIENKIRERLKTNLSNIRRNPLHDRIMSHNFENIITSNYDYGFFDGFKEKPDLKAYPDWESNSFFVEKKEKEKPIWNIDYNTIVYGNIGLEDKYRFRTYYEYERKKFWHVHGEIGNLKTIVLGHEMYSNVISNMEQYFRKGLKEKNPFEFKEIKYGWLDLLFISNVSIVGLSLEFNEIDLWYALNIRARMIKRLNINPPNRIVYYDLIGEYDLGKDKTTEDVAKKDSFIEVLKSHKIEYNRICKSTYREAYEEFLKLKHSDFKI